MGRWLKFGLLALPWLLLVLMTGFAAIGWLHFLSKDEALWERSFADVALAGAGLADIAQDRPAAAADRLRQRLDQACDYLVRYREHLPPKLEEAHAHALAGCPDGP